VTFGFLLRTGPYTSQNADSIYELCRRALARGDDCKVFLYEDGVYQVDRDIKSPQERNIAERWAELIEKGVEVVSCGVCTQFRGQTKDEVLPGVRRAGLASLVKIVTECDRFISFGF
jgi:sulfur relay (sulfurtransferase) complex TusBCD TusD component (DsrE family)